ncbi:calcium-binding protein [Roseicella aerolata]|uniref:calcium-binding protein n=1 Tax=Roseicella aerolata TaxID=2883479 RepID=UPI0021F64202|nr:hypothetical protein [Roseicella aerolata]
MATTTSVPSYQGQGGAWTLIHPDDVKVTAATMTQGPHAGRQLLAITLTYDEADFLDNSLGVVAIQVKEPAGNLTSDAGGGLRTDIELTITNALGVLWTGFDIQLAPGSGALDPAQFHPGYAHFHQVTRDNFRAFTIGTTDTLGRPAGDGNSTTLPVPANIQLNGTVAAGVTAHWGLYDDPDFVPDPNNPNAFPPPLVLHQRTYADHEDGFFILLSPRTTAATEGPDRFLAGGPKADTIAGLGGDDVINGRGGNDTIMGDAGDDTLTGGLGADMLVFAAGHGHDLVTDFDPAADILRILGTGLTSFAQAMDAVRQVGADTVIATGAGSSITLAGTAKATLDAADFAFT